MALDFGPRPTDKEMVETIRYHFPILMHRAMLSIQLKYYRGCCGLAEESRRN